jgi:hypothetical protein
MSGPMVRQPSRKEDENPNSARRHPIDEDASTSAQLTALGNPARR